MRLIHHAFDKIDLTLQGAAPDSLIAILAKGKEQAIKQQASSISEIGGRLIRVKESGSRGGYSYSFDTGEEAIIFAIKDSQKADGWNIRAFISSLMLATNGYEAAFAELFDWLRFLGITGVGGKTGELGVSLSRVDYCFDFLMPESFQPNPKAFVFHSGAKKSVEYYAVEGNSKDNHSIRIGKMPNKQLAVYNKSIEVRQRRKDYWFEIWGIERFESRHVWRFELRSGKEHLQKHNIKTLADFREHIIAAMQDNHQTIRYVQYRKEGNRSRFPNARVWNRVGDLLPRILTEPENELTYNEIMPYRKESKHEILFKQMIGLSVNLAIQEGHDAYSFEEYLDALPKKIMNSVNDSSDYYLEKFKDVSLRNEFLYEE